MKAKKNILIAFILNLLFSVVEFVGGTFTGSVAIISDSLHDFADAISIGFAYLLEKMSNKDPDNKYTYGYIRYSVLGSFITIIILLVGSILVIYNAIKRMINPVDINYNGMLIICILGIVINYLAAYITKDKASLNQKAVNLHMLEDFLGWIVVLIGAIVMKFTDIKLIDPIISIAVACFIFINALKTLKEILDLFLEKLPDNIDMGKIKKHLLEIEGVLDIHHIHIRSLDGVNNYATMHVVVNKYKESIKNKIKEELEDHGIGHATVEFEEKNEKCECEKCSIRKENKQHKHHH